MNSFHPFGCAINDSKNIIETITYCIWVGPPNPHEGEKNAVVGWGWVGEPGVCGGGSCPVGRPDTPQV